MILAGTVAAVAMALGAGSQQADYGQDQVYGTLAAEAKMAEILASEYIDLDDYNGAVEQHGSMLTADNVAYPGSYFRLGRSVSVTEGTQVFEELRLIIEGQRIIVEVFDIQGRVVCKLSRFVPEPQE